MSGWQGVSRLRRKLRRIEPEAREDIRLALQDGAAVIRDEARRRVPVDTGALRDAIQVYPGSSRDGLSFRVGVKQKGGKRGFLKRLWPYYARWVEFGTRASFKGQRLAGVVRVGRKLLKRLRKAGRSHPGTPPRPFLFPAFEAKKREVFRKVQAATSRVLERVSRGG